MGMKFYLSTIIVTELLPDWFQRACKDITWNGDACMRPILK
jgi:hypothetical protein